MDETTILVTTMIAVTIIICSIISHKYDKTNEEEQQRLISLKNKFETHKAEFETYKTNELLQLSALKESQSKDIEQMILEKTDGFPYLADAIGEYIDIKYNKTIYYLKNKKRPALKAADEIKQLKKEYKQLKKESSILKYTIAYYEHIFPELVDYKSISSQEFDSLNDVDCKKSSTKQWLSNEEYLKLDEVSRNQLALNRYISRKKNNVEIGLEYERYIGFLYESKGYRVCYYGALKKKNDLGIDLICTKGNKILIIQCKRWAKHKEIHENHINQLFGTALCYAIRENLFNGTINLSDSNIFPIIYSSTKISKTAKEFAALLNVQCMENFPLKDFPRIKCNINNKGEKIYHLPFDQQYDKVQITNDGECYAYTVQEAEQNGFRRAKKWISTD